MKRTLHNMLIPLLAAGLFAACAEFSFTMNGERMVGEKVIQAPSASPRYIFPDPEDLNTNAPLVLASNLTVEGTATFETNVVVGGSINATGTVTGGNFVTQTGGTFVSTTNGVLVNPTSDTLRVTGNATVRGELTIPTDSGVALYLKDDKDSWLSYISYNQNYAGAVTFQNKNTSTNAFYLFRVGGTSTTNNILSIYKNTITSSVPFVVTTNLSVTGSGTFGGQMLCANGGVQLSLPSFGFYDTSAGQADFIFAVEADQIWLETDADSSVSGRLFEASSGVWTNLWNVHNASNLTVVGSGTFGGSITGSSVYVGSCGMGSNNFAAPIGYGFYWSGANDKITVTPSGYMSLFAGGATRLSLNSGGNTSTAPFVVTATGTNKMAGTTILSNLVVYGTYRGPASFSPYIITPGSTASVYTANGDLQALTCTNATYIALEDADVNKVHNLRLELVAGTNAVTWSTNVVGTTSIIPSTNSTTTIMFDRQYMTTQWRATEL